MDMGAFIIEQGGGNVKTRSPMTLHRTFGFRESCSEANKKSHLFPYRKAMAFFRIIACPATSVYIFPLCLSDSLLCSFISERPTRKCLSQFILNEKSRFLQFFLIDACLNTHSMQQIEYIICRHISSWPRSIPRSATTIEGTTNPRASMFHGCHDISDCHPACLMVMHNHPFRRVALEHYV